MENKLVENNFKKFWNQDNLDRIVEKIQSEIGRVIEENYSNPNFWKNLEETRDKNPMLLQKLSDEECKCGSKKTYYECCLWDENFDKSKFPEVLQQEFVKKLIGYQPKVYSEYELKRSGIKHINRYELSVLDVMGVIENQIMMNPQLSPLLVKLSFDLWGWKIKQNNPYLLQQMRVCNPQLN